MKNSTHTSETSKKEHLNADTNDLFNYKLLTLKGNLWLEGLFGMEKENLRVDLEGKLSQLPHPTVFGNKQRHPFITTDFSESQIEMRTPPLSDITQMLGFLETIHDIVSLEIEHEYLWPQSIPPVLPDDQQIPIAQYDEEGADARKYREFLAQKYGPKNQLFSGIHFNFSFGNQLLKILYENSQSPLEFADFKNEVYLKTLRQLLRIRWIYILLYGNSPVVDSTMELKCKLAPEKKTRQVIGLSIRNSCFGYQNLEDLYPDYSSVIGFHKSVEEMILKGKISSPKELYAPVRPKFLKNRNQIDYLEIRFIDNDPLEKTGITKEAVGFLHALALYGLLTREPDNFSTEKQAIANDYHRFVSIYGLNSDALIHETGGKFAHIWREAQTIIKETGAIFQELEVSHPLYTTALENAEYLVTHPEQRKVFNVLNGILKSGYISFHLDQANKFLSASKANSYHFSGFEDLELSTQLLLRAAVKRGVSVEILDRKENFVRLTRHGQVQYIKQATKTSLDNYASILAMENKHVTKRILREAGIHVPDGSEFTTSEDAIASFIHFREKAVVIKPNQTNFGQGITIIKENNDEKVFRRAIEIAFEYDGTLLIEEFIRGKEFRIFVIGNEVVGILHRVPANVRGDGQNNIRELVKIKNMDPLRGKGYRTPLEKIQLGEAEAMFLASQNKDFDYIPAAGEIIFLRENSNISTGGDSLDFTDDVHVSYKKIAVEAAKAMGINITGLDMIIQDVDQEADADNYAIIEMNFNPAIHIHCHPYKGKNRKLNEKLLDALGF